MDVLNIAFIADAAVELDSARAALENVERTHPLHESLDSAYVVLDDLVKWAQQVNRSLSQLGVPVDDLPVD